MDTLQQKKVLIQKKQELMLLEQKLETLKFDLHNTSEQKPYGIAILLFFLGTAIFICGAAGAGVPVIFLPGFILAIAGIIFGIRRAIDNRSQRIYRRGLRKEIQIHNDKIIEIKKTIIEMENS